MIASNVEVPIKEGCPKKRSSELRNFVKLDIATDDMGESKIVTDDKATDCVSHTYSLLQSHSYKYLRSHRSKTDDMIVSDLLWTLIEL